MRLPASESSIYAFERELNRVDPAARRRLGVYYTPIEVADCIVRSLHAALQESLDVPLGLADAGIGNVRILDPAVGSGVFLVSLIRHVHDVCHTHWRSLGCSHTAVRQRWQRFVRGRLLPRMMGLDLMPAALDQARTQIVEELARTGVRLRRGDHLRLFAGNTLAGPTAERPDNAAPQTCEAPVNVVLGNPPFAGVSANTSEWINRLLRAESDGRQDSATSYYHEGGSPLGEKKLWLKDDYVKFIRYCQWQIEQTGHGVVGLVTNHGFLDNPTFRGMRESLLHTFDEINVVDLHGNVKKGERSAANGDESVFLTEQGVALSLFVKLKEPTGKPCRLRRGDLFGPRPDKLAILKEKTIQQLARRTVRPFGPFHFFFPRSRQRATEWQRGIPLDELLPVHTAAPVTARDSLVVGTREEVLGRIAMLRDPSIPDEEIRRRFFPRARSSKYPPGDTRGWKLAEARRQLRADAHWDQHLQPCLYRPFERRWVYWHASMIDWPRLPLLEQPEKLGPVLIARRQTPMNRSYNYFLVTGGLALDGVIRSDNRGSESLFPMFVPRAVTHPGLAMPDETDPSTYRYNFESDFFRTVQKRYRIPSKATVTFRKLLSYVYALFHLPIYRQRFQDELPHGFPRIFLPQERAVFHRMTAVGWRLIACHLEQRIPRANTSAAANDWQIGSYQPIKRCIKAIRQERDIPDNVWGWAPIKRLQRIATATLAEQQRLETLVADNDGWEAVFEG